MTWKLVLLLGTVFGLLFGFTAYFGLVILGAQIERGDCDNYHNTPISLVPEKCFKEWSK